MLRAIVCWLTIMPVALAAQTASTSVFRKEAPGLQQSVDQTAREVPGASILQTSKATYIEEFGIVVSLEVALETPRNPFGDANADRGNLADKQRQLKDKMRQLLTKKAATLQTVGPEQSIVIVVHLFNSNPVDNPNLPKQFMFMVKKSDHTRVTVREL